MSVTEVGCMGIKPGLDIMNKTTPEGKILLSIWNTIMAAPGGPHRVYWGIEVEDSSKLWAFFDWDSVEHHENFAKSHGVEATKDFPKILTHGEFTKHFAVTPSPPKALNSRVTELILAYFPSDISVDAKNSASAKLQESVEKTFKTSDDVQAVGFGWGVENDFPVRGGSEGQKGSILTALVGWPTINARTTTQVMQDNESLLKDLDGVVKLVKLHLKCQSLGRIN